MHARHCCACAWLARLDVSYPAPPSLAGCSPCRAAQVRAVGRLLGVPEQFIKRHPFPGPGLAVRVLGDVTEGDKLDVLRQVSWAERWQCSGSRREARVAALPGSCRLQHASCSTLVPSAQAGMTGSLNRGPALPCACFGCMQQRRCSGSVSTAREALLRVLGVHSGPWQPYRGLLPGLRAVTSGDGMTADWYPFAPAFLRDVSNRICNKVRSINRVVYDITSKPPGTIEWE